MAVAITVRASRTDGSVKASERANDIHGSGHAGSRRIDPSIQRCASLQPFRPDRQIVAHFAYATHGPGRRDSQFDLLRFGNGTGQRDDCASRYNEDVARVEPSRLREAAHHGLLQLAIRRLECFFIRSAAHCSRRLCVTSRHLRVCAGHPTRHDERAYHRAKPVDVPHFVSPLDQSPVLHAADALRLRDANRRHPDLQNVCRMPSTAPTDVPCTSYSAPIIDRPVFIAPWLFTTPTCA